MSSSEYRVIPGYTDYAVDKYGNMLSLFTDKLMKQYLVNGYYIVDAFGDALTETLPVHRAVALAWVENADPEDFTVVNHLDGVKTNNCASNLEWTNYSGNSYHAVNTGLRSDNVHCEIRDFETGLVHEFPSISQASKFMGFPWHGNANFLIRKRYGSLLNGRYEFRYKATQEPWFYENRTEKIRPCRHMVVVTDDLGNRREVYCVKILLKDYQLYKSPSKSIPSLVQFANEKYDDLEFACYDGFARERNFIRTTAKRLPAERICIAQDNAVIFFDSLRQVAEHFGVCRNTIKSRLAKNETIDGWSFENWTPE